MASEQADVMSDELREWVERRAEETGRSPEAVLARSVAAYRFLEGESDVLTAAPERDGVDLDRLSERVGAIERRVDAVERDDRADAGARELRDRIDELDAALDGLAPADHDHDHDHDLEELRERLATAVRTAERAREAVDDLDSRLDEGFDNYEQVLEYLTDTTTELDEKLTRLASAVVSLRRDLVDLEASAAARAAAADITEAANRHGTTRARCDSCDATVELGLLSTPHCPECGSTFDGFEPGTGLFSSARLTVGARPALEGDTGTVSDPSDLLDGSTSTDEDGDGDGDGDESRGDAA
jgi:chromosome segregation ATPase